MESWVIANAEKLQFGSFFILFAVFTVMELVIPKRPGPMMRRRRWTANLIMTILNIVALGLIPITFFGAAMWAREHTFGLLNELPLPLGIFIIANLLGRGFISFATHYLMHKFPPFWSVHRVHHLDTELDISTTVRFHPLEFFAGLLPGIPLVVILGLSPWVLMLYEILDAMVTLFSHANIRLPRRLEVLLRYVIVTPDLHRVHHSSLQPETDSNFSAVFPVWDLVFGTYRTQTRAPQETMPLGLEEVRDERTQSVLWLLGSPFRGWFARLKPQSE